jgi:hypothetical protein
MPITRAYIESAVIPRLRNWLNDPEIAITADADADPSPRAYLDDAIRYGLTRCGVPPGDPSVVGDVEVAALPAALLDRLLDLATVRELETVRSNLLYAAVTTKSYSETRAKLDAIVADLWARIARDYGVAPGTGGVTVGALTPPVERDVWRQPPTSYVPWGTDPAGWTP